MSKAALGSSYLWLKRILRWKKMTERLCGFAIWCATGLIMQSRWLELRDEPEGHLSGVATLRGPPYVRIE
jgi:hypothetical protein